MTRSDILLDPNIYSSPNEFSPERWLEDSRPDERFFVPFGKGTRICQGMRCVYPCSRPMKAIMNLVSTDRFRFAYAELYLAIAMVVRRFELQLYETYRERDIDFCRDCFVSESRPDSPGIRVKVVGIRA